MKFEICKSTIVNDNMPILKITKDNNDGSDFRRVGYLSPFRGYRFQVSGTIDGSGDYGSSSVVGLAKVLYADYTSDRDGTFGYQSNYSDTGAEILCILAESAIHEFNSYIPVSERSTFAEYMNLTFAYFAKKLGKPEHKCSDHIFRDEIRYCDE